MWVTVSSFVHVKFAPLLIVSAEGLNASPYTETLFWLAVLISGADEAKEPGEYEVHPAVIATAPTSTANPKNTSFFTFTSPTRTQACSRTALSFRSLA